MWTYAGRSMRTEEIAGVRILRDPDPEPEDEVVAPDVPPSASPAPAAP